MTKRVLNKEAFTKWHYIQDPTHVCFWSETTFKWVAEKWRASVEFPQADVVLLQKTYPKTARKTSNRSWSVRISIAGRPFIKYLIKQ